MSVERRAPDDPREWLNRARSNLVRAKQRLPEVYLEDLCFDAQQAAERALKAVLISLDMEFPYTHDLTRLLERIDAGGRSVPAGVQRSTKLSDYAVESRYPGLAEPVTEEEYQEAVELAEQVVVWAEEMLAKE